MKSVKTKKEWSPERREELLRVLQARFKKNMNRHEGLEWAKVKAKLEANTENLWSLSEMERTLAVNRILLVMIKRRTNTSFLIVHRKVLKAAQIFATTAKHWIPGKNINRKITPLIWQRPWALSF